MQLYARQERPSDEREMGLAAGAQMNASEPAIDEEGKVGDVDLSQVEVYLVRAMYSSHRLAFNDRQLERFRKRRVDTASLAPVSTSASYVASGSSGRDPPLGRKSGSNPI